MAAKKSTTPRAKKPSIPAQQTTHASKASKPGLRAGTWIMIVIFAALVGAAVYLNRSNAAQSEEVTPDAEPAFVFDGGAPTSIEVQLPGGTAVRIARGADNTWAVKIPSEGDADQAMAEAAASQINALEVLSSIEGNPADFGLENPSGTILVEFQDGTQHMLEIGDATPTGRGYYAQLDDQKILIVGFDGIDSLFRMVTNPPYKSTPTPDPSVTPTP